MANTESNTNEEEMKKIKLQELILGGILLYLSVCMTLNVAARVRSIDWFPCIGLNGETYCT